jgi:hypothetical protein
MITKEHIIKDYESLAQDASSQTTSEMPSPRDHSLRYTPDTIDHDELAPTTCDVTKDIVLPMASRDTYSSQLADPPGDIIDLGAYQDVDILTTQASKTRDCRVRQTHFVYPRKGEDIQILRPCLENDCRTCRLYHSHRFLQ